MSSVNYWSTGYQFDFGIWNISKTWSKYTIITLENYDDLVVSKNGITNQKLRKLDPETSASCGQPGKWSEAMHCSWLQVKRWKKDSFCILFLVVFAESSMRTRDENYSSLMREWEVYSSKTGRCLTVQWVLRYKVLTWTTPFISCWYRQSVP